MLLPGHHLVDADQVLVAEVSRKECNGLHEGVGPLTFGGTRGWQSDQQRSRIMPSNLVGGTSSRLLIDGAELVENGDPDLRVWGNLVTDRNTLQWWGLSHWPVVAEKP